MSIRVAAIQLDSRRDRDANLAALEHWITAAADDGAKPVSYTPLRAHGAQADHADIARGLLLLVQTVPRKSSPM